MKRRNKTMALATALLIGGTSLSSISLAQEAIDPSLKSKVLSVMKDPTSRDIARLFESLKARSSYVLAELKKYPELKPSYYFFDPRGLIFSTQVSQQESMIDQMDFAKSELSNSKLVRLKLLFDDLQSKTADLKSKNVELRNQLGQAVPASELSWAAYAMTKLPLISKLAPEVKESLDLEIAENEKEIALNEKSQEFVTKQLVLALNTYGIQMTEKQLKVLFATVAGDQDLEIISAYANVRKLTVLIQEKLKPGQTTIEMGRDYYGMYALMLASLIHIHESQVSQIKNVYLEKIDALIAKAEQNKDQAESLLQKNADSSVLKGNIKANTQIIDIARQYRKYLEARAERIEKSIEARRETYLEVLNTYKTYDVAEDIVQIIQTSQDNLNALDALSISELPQLVDLGDSNVIDQLSQVTMKISQKP